MKQLKCEMCGSTDLIKQDGMFVCQVCGTRYSVEEAKKMMIEGTVEVQGTVKVDNSSFVEKYLANARRALEKEDWEEVEKYYNLVEQNAPNNMEAVFFSAYGKAMLSFTDQDYFKRQQKIGVLNKSISVISDYFEVTDEDKEQVIMTISHYVMNMRNVPYVYNIQQFFGVGSNSWQIGLIDSVRNAFIEELRQISALHSDAYITNLLAEYQQGEQNGTRKSSDKPKKSLPAKLILSGIITLGSGWLLFFGIIIVGLLAYDRVYFFDGYPITAFLTVLSILAIVVGTVILVIGSIMKFNSRKK